MMHGASLETIRRMTPTQTGLLYREMQAQYLDGLAHRVSVGMAYVSDKSRPKVVNRLKRDADRIRRRGGSKGGGISIGDLAKMLPVVSTGMRPLSEGKVLKKPEEFVKARQEVMKAKQAALAKKTAKMPLVPPGSKSRSAK